MPLSTGKTYLKQFADDPVAQRALLACSAALRLDDESASAAIEVIAQANGRILELLHTIKNLGCVWRQWDGSWYLAQDVRKELVSELHKRIPPEQVSKLRSQLADRAGQRAEAMSPDGQITAHQLRIALIEAGYQRTMVSEQAAKGGEQLGAVWENAAPVGGDATTAGDATAFSVDYLAPEIEKRIGQLPVQVLFLRGMAARARKDRTKQEQYFRAVWKQGRPGRIFAAAAHFYGNLAKDKAIAERALNDSLRWELLPVHHAHVLHSLGKLIGKDRRRWREAEHAYRESMRLDPHEMGRAHVAASLASLLSKYRDKSADAEAKQLAEFSLSVDSTNRWTAGVCYRVLADVYERNRDYPKAIEAVNSLIENDRKLGDTRYWQRRQNQLARLRLAASTVSPPESQPLHFRSPHEQLVQEGIGRVLKEAWESVPDDTPPEDRFKAARTHAFEVAKRLSPHIKREVRKHFETQNWEQLKNCDPKSTSPAPQEYDEGQTEGG